MSTSKKIIGIDLDDTLISEYSNGYDYSSGYYPKQSVKPKFKLVGGVKKFLPKIYKKYDFHIITARSDMEWTKQVIARLEKRLKIKISGLTLTYGKTKEDEVKNTNVLTMIDDDYDNIKNCDRKVILFTNYSKSRSLPSNVIECQSWKDIYEALEGKFG